MDPEELDKQFQAMEGNKMVQEASDAPPPPAAKRKRITTAQVKKELNQLRKDIEEGFLEWVGQLDSRVDKLEEKGIQTPIMETPMLESRLNVLESVGLENLPSFISNTTERFQKLDRAVGALADALTDHIKEAAATPQPAATEIEFAKPPVAIPVAGAETADIAAVASVCLTMNDVLMIARALKDTQDLPEMERVNILNIACHAADVECTHGLRIRAGVKYREA